MVTPSSFNGQTDLDNPFVDDTTAQQNATSFVKGPADEAANVQEEQITYTFEIPLPSAFADLSGEEKSAIYSLFAMIIRVMDLLQELGIAETILIQRKTESVNAENEKLAQIVIITKGSAGRMGDDTDEAKAERNDFMQFLSTLRENIQIKKGEIEDAIKLAQSYATNTQNVANSIIDLLTAIITLLQTVYRLVKGS